MSVEPTTPMSVDKSTMDVEANKSAIRNDRDRFFEVAEYQQDILQYLKHNEVSLRRSSSKQMLRKFFPGSKESPSTAGVHEETARHKRLHAIDSRRLDGRSERGISSAVGDSLARRQLHRSLLELHVGRPCKAAISRHRCHVHRIVSY